MKRPHKISSVILWSVISAAFIGPGTVTTAVTAGSHFQLDLLWAVTFATIACIVLQELSARITISSGLSLGQAVIKKFGTRKGHGLNLLIGGSVVAGCAAYEAGNIMGGVSGLNLLFEGDAQWMTMLVTVVAGFVLWSGRQKWIFGIMTALVGLMGIAFFVLAFYGTFSFAAVIRSSVVPIVPPGAEMLALGLVGTTIVPYNLFLGSGISRGQTIPLMRLGLTISVLIGGFITAWILLAGTLVSDFSSFPELAAQFREKIGPIGSLALGVGLFAAGFSSAITSPFAASIIVSTVWGSENKNVIRLVWGMVLLTGFFFGISGIKPVPVILTVQALNGLILPLVTVYLILIANDESLMAGEHRNTTVYNLLLLLILGSVLLIGLTGIDKTVSALWHLQEGHFMVILMVTLFVVVATGVQIFKSKQYN